MRSPGRPINLQFGKSGRSCLDVIQPRTDPGPFTGVNGVDQIDSVDQIIPSSRGSHSEISGM